MNFQSLEARDRKLATHFLEDARPIVAATPGLTKVSLFNVQDENVTRLKRASTSLRGSKKSKYQSMLEVALDEIPPQYTEIELKATAETFMVFTDLLEVLDELARLRGGIVIQKIPRIFQFRKRHKELPWMLDAIWHFDGE